MDPQKPTGWSKWGLRAMKVSDWAGTHANNVGSSERCAADSLTSMIASADVQR